MNRMPGPLKKRDHNPWLDLFRGIAALLVCMGHTRNALWIDYAAISDTMLWHYPVYLVTSFGHQAVIVFFVLSGYLVGGGVLAKGPDFSWLEYSVARLVRLWTVLVPALIFTAICDYLTLRMHPTAFDGALVSRWQSGPESLVGFSWEAFVGNILFLQTVKVPVYGSNAPLWSLAYEFWYYLLFPLVAAVLGQLGKSRRSARLMNLAVIVILVLWLPAKISFYFSVWLLGAICSIREERVVRQLRSLRIFATALFALSLIAAKAIRGTDAIAFVCDVFVAISFALLMVSLRGWTPQLLVKKFPSLIITKLSDISYSLYLFHFPMVALIAVTTVGTRQLSPSLSSTVALLGVTLICLLISYGSWLIFERRNVSLRKKVSTWLVRTKGEVTAGRSAE
ncbi:acyltransferase [Cupriavidus sp. BIC8F]|uniref:acyltransferase family protein n=1 Tax=Cupriavidus sp. BIC8F TaxID=3079014 RepID=UPI002916435E|nr:acyltransferase [Cupriavidus sp. BIC8F]